MNLPFEGYLPHEAKKAATGKMNASKEEVIRAVKRRWKDFNFPQAKKHLEAVCDGVAAVHDIIKHVSDYDFSKTQYYIE